MSGLTDAVDVAYPQEPHVPVILLLDTSDSMNEDDMIGSLNKGLEWFKKETMQDDLASKRVDVAIVTFSTGVELHQDFVPAEDMTTEKLTAQGVTAMGNAINFALDKIEARKKTYKKNGIPCYCPWVFMISDGLPTDIKPGDGEFEKLKQRLSDGEKSRDFLFFPVMIEGSPMDWVSILSPRAPAVLQPGRFKELFEWLSVSLSKVSVSRVGEQVALEAPEEAGWGKVKA